MLLSVSSYASPTRHPDALLVPPFDVKLVWLAHMIRVEKVHDATIGTSVTLLRCLSTGVIARQRLAR